MYELIATAAAGIQAGVGLHAALAGVPVNGGTSAQYYHGRTRFLSLVLSATSCGCAAAAYYQEGRGDLWLVAATGAALSVPYHLLLMSPTNPYLPNAGFSSAEAAAAASALGTPATADASSDPAILASHKLPGETEDVLPRYTNQRTTINIPNRRPLHGQLSYSPSGVLVPAEVASGSWTKRYWFGAALSMASFGAMMAILASKRDMAGFVAPF